MSTQFENSCCWKPSFTLMMQLLLYPEKKCSETVSLSLLCYQKASLAKLSQQDWKDLGLSLVLGALKDT